MRTSPSEPAGIASVWLTDRGTHCGSCPALIEEALAGREESFDVWRIIS